MPMRTGLVKGVEPHPTYRARYHVYLLGLIGPPIYTLNAWHASLCERACALQQPITAATRETRFGEEIVRVELAPESPQEAA
jgi:hypothetical protein